MTTRQDKVVVLASSNKGKLTELGQLLKPLGVELKPQTDFGVEAVAETEKTFLGNALLKARHASAYTDLPAIADDSGLAVDSLHGAPGVRSARFAGEAANDRANNAKLITELRAIDPSFSNHAAHFHCVLVYVQSADDQAPLIARGRMDGRIIERSQGHHGFGYDPHFFLPEENCTVAELATERKNQLSHRGQAVRRLLALLTTSGVGQIGRASTD